MRYLALNPLRAPGMQAFTAVIDKAAASTYCPLFYFLHSSRGSVKSAQLSYLLQYLICYRIKENYHLLIPSYH